jgi:hypothetical protein
MRASEWFIEREENLYGEHTPGKNEWCAYAGPFKDEIEAKTYSTRYQLPETYRIVEVKR